VETFLQDIRYSLRGFRRNPAFTLTILATLVLGIGVTTAVFSVVDRILFRPLPYAHGDELVSVGLVQSLETNAFMLGYFYYDWRRGQQPFLGLTSERATTGNCDLTEARPAQIDCTSVEGNFLPTLGVSPVVGRNFLPEEVLLNGPSVALISYGLWSNRYGQDRSILNKTIHIDGSAVRVVGVLPKDFEMPRLQSADVLFPLVNDEAADRVANSGLGGPRRVFARLKPGVSIAQAEAELQPLLQRALARIPSDIRYDFHLRVQPLRDMQMKDVRQTAWVLLGAVFMVLLVACANIASLLSARGAARQRERAVRGALGASRARLARQSLTESTLLAVAGGIGGCVLAEVLLRILLTIAPANIPYLSHAQLDLRIFVATILLALFCGTLFGLPSALQRAESLVLNSRSSTVFHTTLRKWLVVMQIAASMVLLAGAGLLLRSFRKMEDQNLGMHADTSMCAAITLGNQAYATPESRFNFFRQLTTRLQFGPGVTAVSVSDSIPPGPGHLGTRLDEIQVQGKPSPTQRVTGVVGSRLISRDYFRALDIRILQGFREEQMAGAQNPVVVSKRLAKLLFGKEDPIGQHIRGKSDDLSAPWNTVVGVAADVKNGGLTKEEEPEMCYLRRDLPGDWDGHGRWDKTSVVVVRSSMPPNQTSSWIRGQVAALDATLPIDLATLQERVSKLAAPARFQTLLVTFFAATGLALALIGLYGVIAFLVAQRTQEIGVRMALGANKADILRLVMVSSLKLILTGTVLGAAAALAATHFLASLLYGVGPYDPVTFCLVTIMLITVAVAATLGPARAAAGVNPIVALRCD
jgi:putative ABC transport system permease protein